MIDESCASSGIRAELCENPRGSELKNVVTFESTVTGQSIDPWIIFSDGELAQDCLSSVC